ncbi:hypothetical protein [Streptomyces pyxinicus]|uniref:hypothetical protein n=1 Tax=Streptomyces pyxinicus TaxID=2970331 RepID=UPI002867B426|nr:hypothetical protein [Streptomyces sp. LP11]
MVVTGLVIVADWLASQTEAITAVIPALSWRGTPEEVDEHWERARKVAPAFVANAQLGRARFGAERFEGMFPFPPNALQADLTEHLPVVVNGAGLLLVTAPTGDGKTEAALCGASVPGRAAQTRGMAFALPTMSTADAMYPRVEAFARDALVGDRALTLLHSMAWLSPVYSPAGPVGAEADSLGESSTDPVTATEAGAWLRGR